MTTPQPISNAARSWSPAGKRQYVWVVLALLLAAAVPPLAQAGPTFSLEDADGLFGFPPSDSLVTLGYPAAVGGSDLFTPATGTPVPGPLPPPLVGLSAAALGLPVPPVDIDAVSFGTDPITLTLAGADNIVFSADRFATGGFPVGLCLPGLFPPDIGTECGAGPPFGASPGDINFSPLVPPFAPFGPPSFHTTQTDEDGIPSPFPPPNPFPPLPGLGLVDGFTSLGPSFLPDNLDALEIDDVSTLGGGPVYFSLDFFGTGASPAVLGASGADVLKSVGGVPAIYAPGPAIGLDVFGGPFSDDLDALALLDDGDGLYNAVSAIAPCDDTILYSVSHGSFLTSGIFFDLISGLPFTPGDILTDGACVTALPCPCPGVPVTVVHAEQLGLNSVFWDGPIVPPSDDLNALDVCTDTDGDMACDAVDNCPTKFNLGQADADADGIGDVCEFASMGVVAKKFIVIDKLVAASKAKTVFVAKDPAATKGGGLSTATIRVDFDATYDGETGNFDVPVGASNGTDGWLVNKTTVAKYVNKAAPVGPTATKVAVIKPGKLLKLIAKERGDGDKLDILAQGAPTGSVYTSYCVTNPAGIPGPDASCHCTEFSGCSYKAVGGGTGAKLVCKSSVGDPACTAVP